MSNNNLSNENINVINQDDTVDDSKKKKRRGQNKKNKRTHDARKNLEEEVSDVYKEAKALDKDTDPVQVLRYLSIAFAMIAEKKDDDTLWTSQIPSFDKHYKVLWRGMIFLKEDAETAKKKNTERAEVRVQLAIEQLKADAANAEVKIKEATCSADVQKCSIESEADVKNNETVAQGIGDISKSTTDVGVKMCGIKSTSDILKNGAAVQDTDEITAETEQAQMEPLPSEPIHENVEEKEAEKAVVDALDKFKEKFDAGAMGSVTIPVKVSESDKDRDDIEILSIDVSGSMSRSAKNKTLSKAKVANSEAFYTPSDWESGAGTADEAETDDDDDDKFATDNNGKKHLQDEENAPIAALKSATGSEDVHHRSEASICPRVGDTQSLNICRLRSQTNAGVVSVASVTATADSDELLAYWKSFLAVSKNGVRLENYFAIQGVKHARRQEGSKWIPLNINSGTHILQQYLQGCFNEKVWPCAQFTMRGINNLFVLLSDSGSICSLQKCACLIFPFEKLHNLQPHKTIYYRKRDTNRRRSDRHETPPRKKQKTMKDITPGGSLYDFIGIIKSPE